MGALTINGCVGFDSRQAVTDQLLQARKVWDYEHLDEELVV